jgi:hypothetical protein
MQIEKIDVDTFDIPELVSRSLTRIKNTYGEKFNIQGQPWVGTKFMTDNQTLAEPKFMSCHTIIFDNKTIGYDLRYYDGTLIPLLSYLKSRDSIITRPFFPITLCLPSDVVEEFGRINIFILISKVEETDGYIDYIPISLTEYSEFESTLLRHLHFY